MNRVPVEFPPSDLLDQIKKQNVIPVIGAGLSQSAQIVGSGKSAMPDYRQLLEQLLDRAIIDEEYRNIIRSFLKIGKSDPIALEKAARELRENMKDYPFYTEIRSILEPIDAQIKESVGHRLLRMLNFKYILTTNYDRLLERFVAPDYEVFTPNDINAFRIFLSESERHFILKLHGDITRPDTIPFGLTDLYRHYGYESDGNKLIKEMPQSTKFLRNFLETLFREHTVLFLGSSLSESEGYARLLMNLADEWGGSLPNTHYALVPKDPSAKKLRKYLSKKMNVKYIEYEPDDVHSQVWEFIAFLNAGVSATEPIPGRTWEKSFLPNKRVEYLQRQLKLEQTARQICYLTPSLTNAITTEEDIMTSCRTGLEQRFSNTDFINQVLEKMNMRRKNIENRLNSDELYVKILFLETELNQSFATNGKELENTIERYRYLLELIKKPNLEVRLIPKFSSQELKENYFASYAIIFNDTNLGDYSESDVSVAYASQATVNYFEIHLIQTNTTEVMNRVYQFERFWASAKSEPHTVKHIQNLIKQSKYKFAKN